jgi:hypothetical protein
MANVTPVYEVQFDFEAQGEEELSVRKGRQVIVLRACPGRGARAHVAHGAGARPECPPPHPITAVAEQADGWTLVETLDEPRRSGFVPTGAYPRRPPRAPAPPSTAPRALAPQTTSSAYPA